MAETTFVPGEPPFPPETIDGWSVSWRLADGPHGRALAIVAERDGEQRAHAFLPGTEPDALERARAWLHDWFVEYRTLEEVGRVSAMARGPRPASVLPS